MTAEQCIIYTAARGSGVRIMYKSSMNSNTVSGMIREPARYIECLVKTMSIRGTIEWLP